MKKKLIILSDLWGAEKSEWLLHYTKILERNFDIVYYDCCVLGEVDVADFRQEKLHAQFINGGIEKAVEKLIAQETSLVNILAFSIGGAIAWKFGLKTKKIESLVCVSSTRLRYETEKPEGKITLYFGSEDLFVPNMEWFEKMALNCVRLNKKDHSCYEDAEVAKKICSYF